MGKEEWLETVQQLTISALTKINNNEVEIILDTPIKRSMSFDENAQGEENLSFSLHELHTVFVWIEDALGRETARLHKKYGFEFDINKGQFNEFLRTLSSVNDLSNFFANAPVMY